MNFERKNKLDTRKIFGKTPHPDILSNLITSRNLSNNIHQIAAISVIP